MREALLRLVEDSGALHNRLIVVAGGTASARADLLLQVARSGQGTLLQLSAALAHRLLPIPRRQRPLQAASLLREAVDAACPTPLPALLDRLEILFDQTLQLDPLETLKRLSHARTVVVNWPGEARDGRLIYAQARHPERRDYSAVGVVTYQLH